jgi:NADH dehydrogenase FAD-containing subunit
MAASLSIQTTEVPGWPQVWAIGDCAEIKQADGKVSPATADHNHAEGQNVRSEYCCLMPRRLKKAVSVHGALEGLDHLVADRQSLKS